MVDLAFSIQGFAVDIVSLSLKGILSLGVRPNNKDHKMVLIGTELCDKP